MYIAGLERCEKKKPREKGANKYQKSRRIFWGKNKKSIHKFHLDQTFKKTKKTKKKWAASKGDVD
jgi:hypothetical protein